MWSSRSPRRDRDREERRDLPRIEHRSDGTTDLGGSSGERAADHIHVAERRRQQVAISIPAQHGGGAGLRKDERAAVDNYPTVGDLRSRRSIRQRARQTDPADAEDL